MMKKIEKGHEMYREGKYMEALEVYTSALHFAQTNPQNIALHSNRAACFLKLHQFHKAAEECTSVLELDYNHTGALMLRAQTLVTLKKYQSALFDVNRLTELDPSSEVYQNLHTRLKTQLMMEFLFDQGKSLAPIPEDEAEQEELDEEDEHEKIDKEDEHKEKEDKEELYVDQTSDNKQSGKATFCAEVTPSKTQNTNGTLDQNPNPGGWQAIPKPKGHSQLDYSRWDMVEDDSSEDDDEDSQPQFRFRVKTVGVRPVK